MSKRRTHNDARYGQKNVSRAIKVRIYPTEQQQELFQKTFGCCRFYWNQALNDEQEFYAATDKHYIPTPAKYKSSFPFLKEIDSLALANVQMNLNLAFSTFFDKDNKSRYPNFKSKKKSRKSYTTNCQVINGNSTITVTKDGIKLPKVGVVAANLHRNPMKGWSLKSATISQSPAGNYYCSVLYECYKPVPDEVLPDPETTIGLDYSSPLFYVDSNGYSPERFRWFRASEGKLAREQRKLSHMKYGSKNYEQQKRKVASIHDKIANQRIDFIHKESRKIANSCSAVCVEDLNLRALSQSLKLGKSTNDNGFGMFRNALEYKLADQGKHLIVIDKWFPSSKLCGNCGFIYSDLQLNDREWTCPCCGTIHPRDKDAACNIRDYGLQTFYADRVSTIA